MWVHISISWRSLFSSFYYYLYLFFMALRLSLGKKRRRRRRMSWHVLCDEWVPWRNPCQRPFPSTLLYSLSRKKINKIPSKHRRCCRLLWHIKIVSLLYCCTAAMRARVGSDESSEGFYFFFFFCAPPCARLLFTATSRIVLVYSRDPFFYWLSTSCFQTFPPSFQKFLNP